MPLAHTIVRGSKPAEGYVLMLHGVLGTRSNWGSIARRLVRERPHWAVVTVDLRLHGDSTDSAEFAPPHTIQSAADDLSQLATNLDIPVVGVLGHSLGGKIALEYATSPNRPSHLTQAWIVDSYPGARPDARGSEGTLQVFETLKRVPKDYDTREAFVARLESQGLAPMVAQWLAMNLKRTDKGVRFPLDLGGIEELLGSYFHTDLWPRVETPPAGMELRFILGGASPIFDDDGQARLVKCPVRTHIIDGAGHWVHVDAPGELTQALLEK